VLSVDEAPRDERHGQHSLTPEERSEAANLIESGRSLTAVSRKFDVPESVLRGLARESPITPGRDRVTESDVELTDDGAVERARETRMERQRVALVPQRAASNLARRLSVALVERGRQPYVSPGRSALSHWRLVAAVIAAAMSGALALGLTRPPVYSADAKLIVGKTVQLNNLAAIPGLAAAGQQLASDYSRLISTGIVTREVGRHFHGSLGGSLSASPIPQSPVVVVSAKATSRAHAVALANAGSAALVKAVEQLNTQQSKATANLLQDYQRADQLLVIDTRVLTILQQQQAASPADSRLAQLVANAQTQVDKDTLQRDAIAGAYRDTYSPSKLNEQIVQRVGRASPSGNDRKTFLEIALLAALVGGFVIGSGAAVLVDVRRRTRI
jgi:capsular polysaccharide biosynthesis protein